MVTAYEEMLGVGVVEWTWKLWKPEIQKTYPWIPNKLIKVEEHIDPECSMNNWLLILITDGLV
jgi:hypothetical protein